MTNIRKGLCWAAVILLTAVAKRQGIFDANAADTLLLVLPILAFQSLQPRRACGRSGQSET